MFVDGLIYMGVRVNAKSPRTVHVFLCVTIPVPEDSFVDKIQMLS